jgi:hypothetical protein
MWFFTVSHGQVRVDDSVKGFSFWTSCWQIGRWSLYREYQQHDVMFTLHLWLLLSQDGVNPPHERVMSVFLQQLCAYVYSHYLLLNLLVWLRALDQVLEWCCPFWWSFFPSELGVRIVSLPSNVASSLEVLGLSSLNPTIIPLDRNRGGLSFLVSRILAQLTKIWWHESCVEWTSAIKVVHYIITCTLHHTICTMCIMTAPLYKL